MKISNPLVMTSINHNVQSFYEVLLVVLVLRLTGQFLFIYFFFMKDILNVKKHKQKHLS